MQRTEKKENVSFQVFPLVDVGAVKPRPSRLLLGSLGANDVMQFLEWGLMQLDGCGLLDGRVAHSVSLPVLLPDGSGGGRNMNKTGSSVCCWLVVLHWWLVVALTTMLVVNESWRSVTH
jgi:hypothetical protein